MEDGCAFGGSDLTFDPSLEGQMGSLILLIPYISIIIGLKGLRSEDSF